MKKIFLAVTGLWLFTSSPAQSNGKIILDSIPVSLWPDDTNKVIGLRTEAERYINLKIDSSVYFVQEALNLSLKLNFDKGKIISLFQMGKIFMVMGNYNRSLDLFLQSLQVSERTGNTDWQAYNLLFTGQLYSLREEYRQALKYFSKAKVIADRYQMHETLAKIFSYTGQVYDHMGKLDSARMYALESYDLVKKYKQDDYLAQKILNSLGDLYFKSGDDSNAIRFYRLSLVESNSLTNYIMIAQSYLGLANVFHKLAKTDSSYYYASQSFAIAAKGSFMEQKLNAANFLAWYFKERKMFDSAYIYLGIAAAVKDSLISKDKIHEFEKISFSEEYRQQGIEQAKIKYRNEVRMYILAAGLLVLLIIAIVLWRNVWNKQRANKLLTVQKIEIDKQREKIEASYKELKLTQAQLVQAEKMASLGELTAGVAHEIQNPLNFINNFSEVSRELLEEMKVELDKGNSADAGEIANSLVQNLEKINHHGKRADAIVKGMLQHSRSSSGLKEPTDVNALCDEYLRLSYHGLRARDKSFNAGMKTDFDESIKKINIISQDVGRVVMNLLTNAFYAVNEKALSVISTPTAPKYEPTVSITTKKLPGFIQICVKDNGTGIHEKVLDKIFQPFFTTKPSGQGTGLGLSLSYDIITKAHGGELKVETIPGEGTTFIILLPIV